MINGYYKDNIFQDTNHPRIIAHIVNNKGGFGKGFALQVAKKYPIVSNKYKEWYGESLIYGDARFQLGDIQVVRVDKNLTFVNMLAQNGYQSRINPIPLNYRALLDCLEKLSKVDYKDDVQIWMPKIGSGLANGDWKMIEALINRALASRTVRIFEL